MRKERSVFQWGGAFCFSAASPYSVYWELVIIFPAIISFRITRSLTTNTLNKVGIFYKLIAPLKHCPTMYGQGDPSIGQCWFKLPDALS